MSTLMQASYEWLTRPADERFGSVQELLADAAHSRSISHTRTAPMHALRVTYDDNDDLCLDVAAGTDRLRSSFTNWSFGQMCRAVGASPDFIAKLTPSTIQTVFHDRFKSFDQDEAISPRSVLFAQNGRTVARAITSEAYNRIHDDDVARRLLKLENDYGWRVPPARPVPGSRDPRTRPATEKDLLACRKYGIPVKLGDAMAPAGLYRSDRDMFAFMVNEDNPLVDPKGEPLFRGFFITNSEVGARSLTLTMFLYRGVCGNHIVWGASNVIETRVRHIGKAADRALDAFVISVRDSVDSVQQRGNMQKRLSAAAKTEIAATSEDVLDAIFNMRINGLSRIRAEQAHNLAIVNESVDGNPRSFYGMFNGLTRLSQRFPNQEDRLALDKAAYKVLEKCPV